MLRAGLLSDGQVADAAEHARVKRLPYVDAVLELGLADEDTLVAFLASKLLIPRVRQAVLERIDPRVADRLPAELAWQLLAVPVSTDELGNLTVAMADPSDEEAVAAIAQRTRSYLVRAVASVSSLRRTLYRLYGDEETVYQRAAAQRAEDDARAREHRIGAELSLRQTDVSMIAVDPARPPQPAPWQVAASVPPSPFPSSESEAAETTDETPYSQPPSDDELDAYAVEHVQGDPEDSIPTHVDTRSPARMNPVARPQPPEPAFSTFSTTFSPIVEDDEPPLRVTAIQTDAPPERRITEVQTEAPSARTQPVTPSQPAAVAEPSRPPTPTDMVEGPARGPRRPNRPRAHTPWNPPLQGFNSQPTPLSPEAVAEVLPKLEAASDRDEITSVLLDFLGAGFHRVILFVHSHNELKGHDARGEDLMVEAVRQVRIPSTGKSVFSEVLEAGRPYFGPMRETSKIDQAFSSALGGLKGNVLVLPIQVGTKVPLLVFAHGTTHPVDPHSIAELSTAVSTAIQRLIASMRRG